MNIVFFGTPWFAAHILEYLVAHNITPCAIVTKEDKPIGRSRACIPPPVKQVSLKILPNTPIYQPAKVSTPEMEKILAEHQADLFVVVAYGEIIKTNILSLPKKGCINVHASLLPLLRGASPIQQSIIEGHKKTGITIMDMVLKMDAGDIIRTAEVEIPDNMTAGELEKKLCDLACPLLVQVLSDFEVNAVTKIPQDHAKATYVKKIQQEDCCINWLQSAQQIHDLVRGLQPKPAAWCEIFINNQKKRVKIHKTTVIDQQGAPKELLEYSKRGIVIGTGEKAIKIEILQLEGKKAMSASEFTRGLPSFTVL